MIDDTFAPNVPGTAAQSPLITFLAGPSGTGKSDLYDSPEHCLAAFLTREADSGRGLPR